jgi:hypothetical protein
MQLNLVSSLYLRATLPPEALVVAEVEEAEPQALEVKTVKLWE